MSPRTLPLALLALALLGCNVAAPVVGVRPPEAGDGGLCDAPSCALLEAVPPPPAHLAELRGPDGVCPSGRVPKSMTIDEDAAIDARTLECVELTVEVLGAGPTVRVVTVEGPALTRAALHVRSAHAPVELHLEVARIERSEVATDGPIDVLARDVTTEGARFVLEAEAPLAAPRLFVEGGVWTDLEVLGPRGLVRLEDTDVRGAILAVASIVLDRGHLGEASLEAEIIDMLAANVTSADIDATDLVAASGSLDAVHVTRCGQVTLSDLAIVSSYVAACDAPLDVRGVRFGSSVVLGDIVGIGGQLRDTVFGGAHLSLAGGEVFSSALCGTQSVAVERVTCVRCGSSAPADMCGVVSGPPELCPGLCASTCSASGEPTLPVEACAS
jgi:hypothetical protein